MIIHTGDFKIDQTPLDGEHVDVHRFAELGSAGVLALLADSTNIDRRGFTGSEVDVIEGVRGDLHQRRGKDRRRDVLVEHLSDADRGRPGGAVRSAVAFVGRGAIENSEIAQRLGLPARARRACRFAIATCANFPAQDVRVHLHRLAGRAAGGAAAHCDRRPSSREARHRATWWCFRPGRFPGNEKAIGRVMNHIARRDAEVIAEGDKHVHVSGHGSEEELKLMLSLVRPQHFVPIHGEYRQLARHARIATRVSPVNQGLAGGKRRRHPV